MRRFLIITVLAALTSLTLTAQGFASPPTDLLQSMSLAPAENGEPSRARIQTDLAWTGFYLGPTHGRETPETREAILAFQRSIGNTATGRLSEQAREILRDRATATQRDYRFVRRNVEWLGVVMDTPMGFFGPATLDQDTTRNEIEFDALAHPSGASLRLWIPEFRGSMNPQQLMNGYTDAIRDAYDDVELIVSRHFGSSFFIAFEVNGIRVTRVGEVKNGQWRIAEFALDSDYYWTMRPLMARMIRSLDLFAGPGLSQRERTARRARGDFPGNEQMPDWFNTMIANGSGSLVSRRGHILTNHHVIEGCGRLTVNGNPAILVGADARLDLAVIRAEAFANRRPIRFREDNPQLGEAVAVMGYPVFQFSRALNYTTGTVSSNVGLYGDRTRVQITAPIQPGNSGGPVLDGSGRQVAVVVAKASSKLQVDVNVENIGWVIRGQQAVSFLRRYGVNPIVETNAPAPQLPDAETVDGWRSLIMRIECHKL